MKILIIKPSSFGDIVQANPAVHALRSSYKDAKIYWLVFEQWEPIVRLFPDVDETIVWNRSGGMKEYLKLIKTVQAMKFDLVIDLQGLFRTALIAKMSDAPIIIGVPGLKEFSWLLVKEVYPERRDANAVLRSLETVRYLTNRPVEPMFNIKVDQQSVILAEKIIGKNVPVVAIVPFARGKAKEWPIQRYKELAERIARENPKAQIVIVGGKNDVSSGWPESAVDLCGKTSLAELAAVLSRCNAVVGNDTGPVHLAAGLNIPTVTIFGGSDINETAPIGAKAVTVARNMSCAPCRGHMKCKEADCLLSISVEEVLEKVKPWIK
jgi:heptosyltransferase-1